MSAMKDLLIEAIERELTDAGYERGSEAEWVAFNRIQDDYLAGRRILGSN